MKANLKSACAAVFLFSASALRAADVGTAFTYQGTLENGSGPVTDTCDFRFGLWNDSAAGAQVGGSPQTVGAVDVISGSFTVALDFGAGAINGDARWLAIEVKCTGDANFVALDSERVEMTAAPHATRAVSGVGPPNALEIDSVNGRVGMGTNAPQHPLHVVGAINAEQPGSSPVGSNVRLGAPSADPGLSIQRGNGAGGVSRQWDIVIDHTNDLEIRDFTAGSIERMVITDTGLVGIGTTAPGEQLTVAGAVHSTTGGFKFPDGSTQATADTGDTLSGLSCAPDEIAKWDGVAWICALDSGGDGHSLDAPDGDPQDAIVVDNLGNVGIGTGAPATKLDVSGNVRVSGTLASGNSITIDGATGMERIVSGDTLEIHTSSGRTVRIECEPAVGSYRGPNFVVGSTSNNITPGVFGATISGGGGVSTTAFPNSVTDHWGTVAGGYGNQAGNNNGIPDDVRAATVGGGFNNIAAGHRSTVSGGEDNEATGLRSFIGGGSFNEASFPYATVCGGATNRAVGFSATIGGGENNIAIGDKSCVGGGKDNRAAATDAVVAGGQANNAGPVCSFGSNEGLPCDVHSDCPSGACTNSLPGPAVGGGASNAAAGSYATVPGGHSNLARGDYSFAAGRRAHATGLGCFVWGDSTDADVTSSSNNQFTVRSVGGARFFSNTVLSTGVQLAAGGGSWSSISDRDVKRNIEPVNSRAILDQLTQVPLATWNYESQDESIRHIGPMAQDFHAAFGVGEDERYITGIDADGVALAAIQGLHQIVQEKNCEIESLDSEISNLKSEIDELKSLVKALADRPSQGEEK
jgi:hypothetical protein